MQIEAYKKQSVKRTTKYREDITNFMCRGFWSQPTRKSTSHTID